MVEPGNVTQLGERFRVNRTAHDAMTTFMGAATAMLFPSSNDPILQGYAIDTAGTGIEQELMDLIEEAGLLALFRSRHLLTVSLKTPANHQRRLEETAQTI